MIRLQSELAYGDAIFEYDWRLFDYEVFNFFWEEFSTPMMLSFLAVLIVVCVITSDLVVTFVVAICVIFTDLFLAALIYYWNLSLNPIVLLQIILGIGCSVDYSAHIAFAYLIEEIPPRKKK